MLAKKFALGFGIAILLPMLVHYGVSTFSPLPGWDSYQTGDYYQKMKTASPSEKIKLEQELVKIDKEREVKVERFAKYLFFVAVPVGIAAIIVGSVIGVPSIGTGLMFGGIFTLIEGYLSYWPALQDWMKFVSILIAFSVLIFVGYRKSSS